MLTVFYDLAFCLAAAGFFLGVCRAKQCNADCAASKGKDKKKQNTQDFYAGVFFSGALNQML